MQLGNGWDSQNPTPYKSSIESNVFVSEQSSSPLWRAARLSARRDPDSLQRRAGLGLGLGDESGAVLGLNREKDAGKNSSSYLNVNRLVMQLWLDCHLRPIFAK